MSKSAFIVAIIVSSLISGSAVYFWQQRAFEEKQAAIESSEYLFKIYGLGRQAAREEINSYIKIPETISLDEKLATLAWKLSRNSFANHPISLLRIEMRDNKKIALINLDEPIAKRKYSWINGFFQGSCGGHQTTLTLIKTFLQKDYQGEWIDGVQFYYQGEPLRDEWDHINLTGVKYEYNDGSDWTNGGN